MEMLLVLLIISGLTLLILPNIIETKNSVDQKTCDAYIALVNMQIQQYHLDNQTYPGSLEQLQEEGYIDSMTCPDGRMLVLDPTTNKEVIIQSNEE